MQSKKDFAGHSSHRKEVSILVVDNEPDIRSALVSILSLEGYITDEASSGQEALDLLAQRPYHLMILDMRMPGLDGLAVMDRVRQHYPGLLIIILTGHASLDSAIASAKSEEVVDYLLKPLNNEAIVEAVARALEKQVERSRQLRLIQAANQLLEAIHQPNLPAPAPPPAAAPVPPSQEDYPPSQRFISASHLALDRRKRLVLINSSTPAQAIELTRGETAVMAALMTRPDRVLSCEEMVQAVWGYQLDSYEAKNIIRPHIRRLRQKLESDPGTPSLICTVRGRGYRLNCQNNSN